MNYNMHWMLVSLPELLSMLTTTEVSIKKDETHSLLIGGPDKATGKGNVPAKEIPLSPKENPRRRKATRWVRVHLRANKMLCASTMARNAIGRGTVQTTCRV